jgi:hypothetical protein
LLTAGSQSLRASITGDSGRNQSQARPQNEDKRVLLKSSEQSVGCDGIQLAKKKKWLQQFRFLEAFCGVQFGTRQLTIQTSIQQKFDRRMQRHFFL